MKNKLLLFATLLVLPLASFAQSIPDGDITAELSPTGDSIIVSWPAVSDADFFRVYLDGMPVVDISANTYEDVNTPLDGVANYFVTSCLNSGLCSDPSTSGTFWPDDIDDGTGGVLTDGSNGVAGAPQNVTIEDFGDGTAVLRWDPVPGAEKYNIDKNEGEGLGFRYIATTPLTAGTLRVTNIDPDGRPQFVPGSIYRVSAIDEDAEDPFGPWSAGARDINAGVSVDNQELLDAIIALETERDGLLVAVSLAESERDAAVTALSEGEALLISLQAQVVELQAIIDAGTGPGSGTDTGDPSIAAILAALAEATSDLGALEVELAIATESLDSQLTLNATQATEITTLTTDITALSTQVATLEVDLAACLANAETSS